MKAHIVTDLGFGDSGKGTITDYLVHKHNSELVVRFNGGQQVGHRVVTSDGKDHVFASFGSGTLLGCRTLISEYCVFDPLAILGEAYILEKESGIVNAYNLIFVEENALVTTPIQVAANRLREMSRGDGRHGSCGKGVGETVFDELNNIFIKAKDLKDLKMLELKLLAMRNFKYDQLRELLESVNFNSIHAVEINNILVSDDWIKDYLKKIKFFTENVKIVDASFAKQFYFKGKHIVFEGAQGVLLDQWYGFHPHTTWSTTTSLNARKYISDNFDKSLDGVETLGLMRPYLTRHGAGPFPTEDKSLSLLLPDKQNVLGDWQGEWRVGHFDTLLMRYALSFNVVDKLVVTNLDRVQNFSEFKIANRYVSESGIMLDEILPSQSLDKEVILSNQEMLGKVLMNVTPRYYSVPTVNDFLEEIEINLKKKISITSFGETREDKREV